jgi:hypothetical protein
MWTRFVPISKEIKEALLPPIPRHGLAGEVGKT